VVAAYVPGPSGPIVLSTAAAAATTTWDPSNKSTKITLSGGNLIATSGASAGAATAVRSVASHSTGKYYGEFTMTTKTASDSTCIGLVNASYAIDGASFIGQTANGMGYWDANEYVLNNLTTHPTGTATYTTGDVISMAVDTTARLVWFRKNGGNWIGTTSGDPAAGTNGFDISALTGALYAAVEEEVSGMVWTANFGATAYAQAVPSGYGNW